VLKNKRIKYAPSFFSVYTDVSFSSTNPPGTQTQDKLRGARLDTRKNDYNDLNLGLTR